YFKQNNIAILAGGSGLFIDACIKGLHDLPKKDETLRAALEATLAQQGISALQEQLKQLDAEHYQRIDSNNPHRLIRAIEICLTTGKSISEYRNKTLPERYFETKYFVLSLEREKLYQRINERVDKMLDMGLINEAKALYPYRNLQAVNTVGYQELFAYFENRMSLDEAIELIKQNSRRYAKRQITWFKKRNASFIPVAQNPADTAAQILAQIK
ncbi:MAG: tRNA (adenosine(37)-N6)-dimethylallyltransferase MiaA, partial [Flavobacteriaceae bacterium]|nr:tRNA (adenosine(37)-N6)-dimethylallyltransferase MiaA [Flavobacteriaceae bacterium]